MDERYLQGRVTPEQMAEWLLARVIEEGGPMLFASNYNEVQDLDPCDTNAFTEGCYNRAADGRLEDEYYVDDVIEAFDNLLRGRLVGTAAGLFPEGTSASLTWAKGEPNSWVETLYVPLTQAPTFRALYLTITDTGNVSVQDFYTAPFGNQRGLSIVANH